MTGRALLRGALRGERRAISASAVLLAAHQGSEALVPVVVGATLDAAIEPSDGDALVRWLVVLCVLFLFLGNAYRWGARIGNAAMERAAHRLRMRLVERVLDPRGGGEGGRLPGELLSVATSDVDATAMAMRALAFGVAVLAALVAGAAVLLSISVPLGVLVLVGLPVALGLASRLAAPLERRATGEQASFADAAGVAADLVGGHRVLQGLGATGAAAERYRRASRRSLRVTIGAARAEAVVWGSANLVGGVALAAVALVGGRAAAQGEISIGQLIAAVGVTQFLVGPLQRLAWVGGMWARSRASAVRLAAALAVPPAVGGDTPIRAVPGHATPAASTAADGAARAPAVPGGAARAAGGAAGGDAAATGAVAMARAVADGPVGLRVRGLAGGVLSGVDLEVAAGTVHGVVCEPDAARALLDVLAQEAAPAAGTLALVAGDAEVGLVAAAPADVRRLVVVSPHDATLLADTVRANVEVVADGDDDAVRAALGAARADELTGVLPDGLDTVLSDDGASLSGGQRQRVALARALATRAPLLVLHDPTTALDAATEAGVATALREVRSGRTTLLVATSPNLLAVCDAVTVIRDGVTITSGAHDDLVTADAAYRDTVLA